MSYSDIKNRETRQLMSLAAIYQFKNFINGVGKSNSLFRSTTKDLATSDISLDTETKKIVEFINDKYITRLLDTQNGARFMRDIVGGKAFGIEEPESDPNGLFKKRKAAASEAQIQNLFLEAEAVSKSLTFHYEGTGTNDSVSVIRMSEVSQTFSPTGESSAYTPPSGKKDKEGKVETRTAFSFTDKPTDSTTNTNTSLPSKNQPSLGAITFKDSLLSIHSRNSDACAIFFNGISQIEMSRCAPYINIQIIQGDRTQKMGTLNNVSFMRFIRPDKSKNEFVLSDGAGISTAVPVDLSKFGNDDSAFQNRYFSGMEIFNSPQTMANANVRSFNESIGDVSLTGKSVLDPISPFLTLNDFKVSISGLGQGLFASKRADLSLTLHDRSRLKDIAPLVSTELFGTTQMLIEYGWSHPDGDGSRNNPMGEYLNSLRDVGVFNVVTSNFSFGNDNTVKITVKLAAMGVSQYKSVPAAAGEYVPFDVVKSRVNKVLEALVLSENKVFEGHIEDVRPKLKTLSSESGRALIKRSSYSYFDLVIWSLEYQISENLKGWFVSPDAPKNIGQLLTNKDAQSGYSDEIDALLYSIDLIIDDLKESSDSDRLKQALQGKLAHAFALVGQGKDAFRADTVLPGLREVVPTAGDLTVSLGMIMSKFVGVPLAASGQYDEVQLCFYPINQQAGAARIHTTASFPLPMDKLEEMVVGIENNITIEGFVRKVESIISDQSISAYGLTKQVEDQRAVLSKSPKEFTDEARAQLEEEQKDLQPVPPPAPPGSDPVEPDPLPEIPEDAIRKRAKENRQAAIDGATNAFNEQLESIYMQTSGVPAQLSLTVPNITIYTEVLPVISSETGEIDKNICRVHIYDEETNLSPTEAVLQSLITVGESKIYVDNSNAPNGTDSSIKESHEKILEAADRDEISGTNLYVLQKKLTNEQIKNRIKSIYPNIIYGNSVGTIKSMSISSNTSGAVANVQLIQAYEQKGKAAANSTDLIQERDMQVIPASLSLECIGCPIIQRGSQFYVDFGTNTTLDNVYTVVSVSHSLSAGNFSSSVTLAYTGQGNVQPIRKKIEAMKNYIVSKN